MSRALALALALPLLTVGSSASAYCLMTTSQTPPSPEVPCPDDGVPLAWRQRCLGLVIDEAGARDLSLDVVRAAVSRSFDRWTSLECDGIPRGFSFRVEDSLASCQHAAFDYKGENANTLAFVSNFEELGYDESAFAVTIVWHSLDTGEIFDGDMLVNEAFSPYVICPDTGCTHRMDIDLENVVTHEAGHFFGLAHSEEPAATMYARAPRAEIEKRSLELDDLLGFCETYPEPLVDVCDFTPHGGFDATCAPLEDATGPEDGCGCSAAPAEQTGVALFALVGYALVRRRRTRA